MFDYLKTTLKGLVVGATMLVPGVSGGTTAIILGIYDRLVQSVANLRKHFKDNLLFLMLFAMGGGLGILLLAKPLEAIINAHELPMMFFFMGVVLAGIPIMLREAKVKKFEPKLIVYVAIGVALIAGMSILKAGDDTSVMSLSLYSVSMLFVAGFIAAIALVLPGISFSYFMLLLGLYEDMLFAIKELYLPFLIPLGVGLVAGILITTKILGGLMEKHPTPTYMIILGFMLGSLVEVYPGTPQGWEIAICAVALLLGIGLIWLLGRLEGRATADAALVDKSADAILAQDEDSGAVAKAKKTRHAKGETIDNNK